MAFISSSIPNLINGISQQPPSLRRPSQAEVQENAYSSTVEGLVKRNPTNHIANLVSENLDDVFIHTINRDSNEQYVVLIYEDPEEENPVIRVFDIEGNEKVVNYEADRIYLDPVITSYRDGLRALTVADYTFLVNRNALTEMEEDTTPTRDPEALLAIEAGNYGTEFNIYVDDNLVANYETPDGETSNHIEAIATDAIAKGLIDGTADNGASSSRNLQSEIGSDFDITRIGSTIHLKRTDGQEFSVSITDSQGDSSTNEVKDTVQSFSDLPVKAVQDFTVQITGVDTDNFDGYFVRYDDKDGQSGGVWKETVAPGVKFKIRAATMPHSLVREADGSFSFKTLEWGDRDVGDETSAPEPSFINEPINQPFFYRNRLGLLSDDNVVFSRAGEFFQFFPETVTALLDSDPIDVAASSTQVARLANAVPWDERLVIFSDQSQFILEGDPILTPETVTMNLATEFSASSAATPVVSGRNVYFGVNRGVFGAVMEYYRDNSVGVLDAEEVTSHAPMYLPGGLHTLVSQPNEDLLVAAGDEDRSAIYPYKFLWQGEEKLQSSWSKWTFNGDEVLGMSFIRSRLYLVLNREGGVSLEMIEVHKGGTSPVEDFDIHLDRRADESQCNLSYNESEDTTTITLPYNVEQGREFTVVERADSEVSSNPGAVIPVLSHPEPNKIKVSGDRQGAPFYVGENYLMRYQFSSPYIQDSEQGVNVTTGRLNIRFWNIQYANTGFFEVHVQPFYGQPSVYRFNGRIIDQANNRIGEAAIVTGTFKVPVMAKNDEVTIEIRSSSFLPAQFQTADWEAMYFSRSQRV